MSSTSSNRACPYPEVTGYLIPTLLNWGQHALALRYKDWLVSIQNRDGSWNGPDESTSYRFDTGQIIKGLLSLVDWYPQLKRSIIRGCDYILTQQDGSGRLRAPQTPAWRLPLPTVGDETILRAASAGELLSLSWSRCVVTTGQIVTTISGIFRGSIDKGSIGGPVLIAQMAHRSTQQGTGQFLWLLAVLSINLMFLNLLPIPLLDGGQLALLGVEAMTRKPPSEALVGLTQMAGLVVILGLFVVITFNDILRLVRG